jgi:hypothetical protein
MQGIWSAKIFGDREDPRARLHALFGGEMPAAGQPPQAALMWAREVLAEMDAAAAADPVAVTRRLRAAEPRLALRAATFLAAHVR